MKRTNVPKKSILLEGPAYIQIFTFLAKYPHNQFSLTEVAEKVGVSKSTVNRILSRMLKDGFVDVGKLSNLLRIKFNMDNPNAIGAKIGMNLITIYNSDIIDYIHKKFGNQKAIILFGSYRTGEDGPGSDIDIAIETFDEKELEIIGLKQSNDTFSESLKKWEKINEREFKLHLFHRRKVDQNLFVNIANGIVIYGLLEAKP